MALGLPSVNIVFKQEGITAIERGERGIVALVLKDNNALGGHTVYDITDCPQELSEANRRYVIDALKVIEDTEICIEFTTSISPVLFKPVVSNEFTYVVLPIKIKQD